MTPNETAKMDYGPDNLTSHGVQGLGLRFLNEEWNDSISNGAPFTLWWNESLDPSLAPELGLFKITYPRDGAVVYELVSNLTDSIDIGVDNTSCVWTPDNLDDNLYTLFLLSSRDVRSNWTASPPWRLGEPPRYPFHAAAPVIVPVVVLLFLYTLSLTTCVIYRRRKRAKRQKEEAAGEDPVRRRDVERHPSVDTIITVQTLEDSAEVKKPNIWLLTQSPSGSLLLSSNTSASKPALVSTVAPVSEPTLISPISPSSDVNLLTPTSTTSERTLVASTSPSEHRGARAAKGGRTVRVVSPTD